MRLAIYDVSNELIGMLDVPYPKVTLPAVEWQPERLPVTRSDGNLDVTLTGIRFHKYDHAYGPTVEAQVTCVHDGQPSQTWSVSPELQDPLGNVSPGWNCDLSPLEPAWKIRLTLSQQTNGKFLPEETGKSPLIPIPAAGQFAVLSQKLIVNGVEVQLMGFGGPGPLEFSFPNPMTKITSKPYKPGDTNNGMSTSGNGTMQNIEFYTGHPFVITNDGLYSGDMNAQLVIRDEYNQEVQRSATQSNNGMTFWFFEPKPTTTSVQLEFIIQKNRHVEFLIAPPRPEDIKSSQ
jgi:hypothetical protein